MSSHGWILVEAPRPLASALVADGIAVSPTPTRAPDEAIAIGVTLLGVASDVVAIALAKNAILRLLQRAAVWRKESDSPSAASDQLTLTAAGGRIHFTFDISRRDDDDLLVVADSIMALLVEHCAPDGENGAQPLRRGR